MMGLDISYDQLAYICYAAFALIAVLVFIAWIAIREIYELQDERSVLKYELISARNHVRLLEEEQERQKHDRDS